MEKEEYKELEQQMFSKETLALIDEADPAAIRAAFGEIDQHIQNLSLIHI